MSWSVGSWCHRRLELKQRVSLLFVTNIFFVVKTWAYGPKFRTMRGSLTQLDLALFFAVSRSIDYLKLFNVFFYAFVDETFCTVSFVDKSLSTEIKDPSKLKFEWSETALKCHINVLLCLAIERILPADSCLSPKDCIHALKRLCRGVYAQQCEWPKYL